LALPYIFAGLRIAGATVIGLVTVTALIGLGGLGQQITYGFNIGYYTPIIVGLVLSVALAALFDLVVVGVQRLAIRGPGRPGGRGRTDVQVWDHFRHFMASVWDWFATAANWKGSSGSPSWPGTSWNCPSPSCSAPSSSAGSRTGAGAHRPGGLVAINAANAARPCPVSPC